MSKEPVIEEAPRPYVGAMVRFLDSRSPEHCAAIVAHVHDDLSTVNLCIIAPTGVPTALRGVPERQPADRGPSWHWPE